MDTRLYETKLPNHKIFTDLNDSFSENPSGKLRNLIELKDDVFYIWSPNENCLLCLNLKQLEEHGDETPYQKLHFLSPPSFTVERIMTSSCGSKVCVWGSRGVTIAELPSRWGRAGLFDSGSKTVLCKSYSLDERFLYSQGEVRRVHWHPSSLSSSHVLVLGSDNSIRLYSIAPKKGPKLVRILSIGPKPSGQLAGRTILDSLGDTAVDFTPIPDSETLVILRGNGDVYMMQCELETKSPLQPKLTGPLAMYPPADDNYGSESCSITALGGGDTPPLIVVATCSAALYHCLLLPNPTEKEDGDSHALYVVEAVEINMTLNPDQDLQYSYPVHLYPCTNNTYACVHAGGVHTITLPILRHLVDYALADEAETESVLSAMCGGRSSARHAVCAAPPPAGLALAAAPLPCMLVLCGDCTLLARTLEPFDLEELLHKELQLKNPALEQDDIINILKERQKLSFTTVLQEILTREVSQPILNIKKNEEPSPRECLELLSQASLRLRGEYMSRQAVAAGALRRKVSGLRALAQQQARWLPELAAALQRARDHARELSDKCVLADKHQDDLKYRCSAVIRRLRASASPTPAERELLTVLRRYQLCGERLAEQIRTLKLHASNKTEQLEKWNEEYKKKDIALGKSHSDTISSILQQQTSQISTLIEETKLLKDQLSIV
ncbi:nuclear pore complex protein Nup88 [Trichoplusia ni]|uniref:Nuclear pore complex protein Nup88 n=1 Tax=Trichoplusia ni TaxID=7111 RepID=A0A7E5WHL4_TRINI|nr:nuclear pore complex protein Nup88 [Trichoplusia ni]